MRQTANFVNILLCLSHSIEEYDQLRLLSSLGYSVVSLGGYIDPLNPHDPKRPALDIPVVPEIKAAVDALGTDDNLAAAQRHLPDVALDWADIIIYHHRLERLFGQWDHLRDFRRTGRVIWRTVGQSTEYNESQARPFRNDGLEIVRYSPKERNLPFYAGEDALIRFYKDPAEWTGWTGENPVVLNIAQHDAIPHARDEWLNWRFWEEATRGLPRIFAGPHSEKVGGLGTQTLDEMKALLRTSRAYLYTGTQPASYTLGLIEAMMTGIPVVSIGPDRMTIFPYGPDLFEGHEICEQTPENGWTHNDAAEIGGTLTFLLESPDDAELWSDEGRRRAIQLFGMDTIGRQWDAYLQGIRGESSIERETVPV